MSAGAAALLRTAGQEHGQGGGGCSSARGPDACSGQIFPAQLCRRPESGKRPTYTRNILRASFLLSHTGLPTNIGGAVFFGMAWHCHDMLQDCEVNLQ